MGDESWLDRSVRGLCDWFNDFFPGQHLLATVGNGMAGLDSVLPLPVDRRLDPIVLRMAHDNGTAMANAANAKATGGAAEGNCNFWAYCHMSGQPCIWCKGQNALVPQSRYSNFTEVAGPELCPRGKKAGTAWYGCCKNLKGEAKYIAFLDCCGSGTCKGIGLWPRCTNWHAAKNWCTYERPARTVVSGGRAVQVPEQTATHMTGATSYYCTVVIDMGADTSCQ